MHVPRLPRLRAGLLAAALSTCLSGPAFAVGALIEQPFPPIPTPAEYGAAALALGNPLGLSGSATTGIVSALDRPVGQAFEAANRAADRTRERFVDEKGTPRMDRIVPAAVLGVAVVATVVAGLTMRRRRR